MARYVMCCTKCNLQHITLAKQAWVGMAPKSPSPFPILRSADLITLFIARLMTDNRKRAGRKPKADTTVFRCSVNFTATEQATLMSMYDKVQVESMSAFIKMVLFEKPFKVFYMDENTRVFIDKLSSLNSLYRTVGVEYGLIVKTLRENFNEKKAMKALYNLEQKTTELVRISMEIVSLARQFDEAWSQKSR